MSGFDNFEPTTAPGAAGDGAKPKKNQFLKALRSPFKVLKNSIFEKSSSKSSRSSLTKIDESKDVYISDAVEILSNAFDANNFAATTPGNVEVDELSEAHETASEGCDSIVETMSTESSSAIKMTLPNTPSNRAGPGGRSRKVPSSDITSSANNESNSIGILEPSRLDKRNRGMSPQQESISLSLPSSSTPIRALGSQHLKKKEKEERGDHVPLPAQLLTHVNTDSINMERHNAQNGNNLEIDTPLPSLGSTPLIQRNVKNEQSEVSSRDDAEQHDNTLVRPLVAVLTDEDRLTQRGNRAAPMQGSDSFLNCSVESSSLLQSESAEGKQTIDKKNPELRALLLVNNELNEALQYQEELRAQEGEGFVQRVMQLQNELDESETNASQLEKLCASLHEENENVSTLLQAEREERANLALQFEDIQENAKESAERNASLTHYLANIERPKLEGFQKSTSSGVEENTIIGNNMAANLKSRLESALAAIDRTEHRLETCCMEFKAAEQILTSQLTKKTEEIDTLNNINLELVSLSKQNSEAYDELLQSKEVSQRVSNLLGDRLKELQTQLEQTQSCVQGDKVSFTSIVREQESENNALKSSLEKLLETSRLNSQTIKVLEDEKSDLHRTLQGTQLKVKDLEYPLQRMEAIKVQLSQEESTSNTRKESMQKMNRENEELLEQLREVSDESAQRDKDLKSAKESLSSSKLSFEEQKYTLKQTIGQLSSECVELKTKIEVLEKSKNESENKLIVESEIHTSDLARDLGAHTVLQELQKDTVLNLNVSQAKCAELESQLKVAQLELTETSDRLDALREQSQSEHHLSKETISSLQTKLRALLSQVEGLEANLYYAETAQSASSTELNLVHSENGELNRKIARKIEDYQTLSENLDEIRSSLRISEAEKNDLIDVQNQNGELNRKIARKIEDHQTLSENLDEIRSSLRISEAEKNDLIDVQNQNGELNRKIARKIEDHQTLSKSLDEIRSSLCISEAEKNDLIETKEQLETHLNDEIRSLQNLLNIQKGKNKELSSQVSDISEAKRKVEHELSGLQRNFEALEVQCGDLKVEIKEKTFIHTEEITKIHEGTSNSVSKLEQRLQGSLRKAAKLLEKTQQVEQEMDKISADLEASQTMATEKGIEVEELTKKINFLISDGESAMRGAMSMKDAIIQTLKDETEEIKVTHVRRVHTLQEDAAIAAKDATNARRQAIDEGEAERKDAATTLQRRIDNLRQDAEDTMQQAIARKDATIDSAQLEIESLRGHLNKARERTVDFASILTNALKIDGNDINLDIASFICNLPAHYETLLSAESGAHFGAPCAPSELVAACQMCTKNIESFESSRVLHIESLQRETAALKLSVESQSEKLINMLPADQVYDDAKKNEQNWAKEREALLQANQEQLQVLNEERALCSEGCYDLKKLLRNIVKEETEVTLEISKSLMEGHRTKNWAHILSRYIAEVVNEFLTLRQMCLQTLNYCDSSEIIELEEKEITNLHIEGFSEEELDSRVPFNLLLVTLRKNMETVRAMEKQRYSRLSQRQEEVSANLKRKEEGIMANEASIREIQASYDSLLLTKEEIEHRANARYLSITKELNEQKISHESSKREYHVSLSGLQAAQDEHCARQERQFFERMELEVQRMQTIQDKFETFQKENIILKETASHQRKEIDLLRTDLCRSVEKLTVVEGELSDSQRNYELSLGRLERAQLKSTKEAKKRHEIERTMRRFQQSFFQAPELGAEEKLIKHKIDSDLDI